MLDRPVLVEIIKLTLHQGVWTTRTATIANDVGLAIAECLPHLAILDMDLDSNPIMSTVGAKPGGGMCMPVIGLTCRGDLKTKLAAFEAGVADILTVPFAPEELLARVIALLRRPYGDAVMFAPSAQAPWSYT